ncbi:DUF6220 domain-containing protein [Salininema proteolyticum]|uniref:DUF6220 domain-containing protein n=1 Tax=Salininema proteolyticum TaxID=1607685 RepID=A0ABV8TWX6_9ACTN
MKKFLTVWLRVTMGLLGLQIALAGFGAVGGGELRENFNLHILNGRAIAVAILLALVFALIAKAGKKSVLMLLLAVGLMVLQALFAMANVPGTTMGQVLFFFHAINGLIIMGVVESAFPGKEKPAPAEEAEPAAAR